MKGHEHGPVLLDEGLRLMVVAQSPDKEDESHE
ncbi:hypothetical protein PBI_SEBATA_4 [Mycobacterium phage Sebata]|uniref:Uncharacterized protein n=2 Tax=Bixzunavirus TaxID=680114 RepID=G1JXA1_9CAUD|nr:hypothetical protein LINSTU_4 [Mycobacterium phage LinStu]YP_009608689.1 hypothetical protein FDI20_gp004 [Mycobacterium phage Sebata]AEK06481.1 hypothetical protein PBI_SEBATA_4 [Mycobacterium phage Sebata]AEL98469.1 hypothetical protein LINSTU_4 [Mycobacterium phage LinStu]UVD40546.1 hypothetical protein SEA_IKELOA_4 [Mycobacterium phage IkeLoa]